MSTPKFDFGQLMITPNALSTIAPPEIATLFNFEIEQAFVNITADKLACRSFVNSPAGNLAGPSKC